MTSNSPINSMVKKFRHCSSQTAMGGSRINQSSVTPTTLVIATALAAQPAKRTSRRGRRMSRAAPQ